MRRTPNNATITTHDATAIVSAIGNAVVPSPIPVNGATTAAKPNCAAPNNADPAPVRPREDSKDNATKLGSKKPLQHTTTTNPAIRGHADAPNKVTETTSHATAATCVHPTIVTQRRGGIRSIIHGFTALATTNESELNVNIAAYSPVEKPFMRIMMNELAEI